MRTCGLVNGAKGCRPVEEYSLPTVSSHAAPGGRSNGLVVRAASAAPSPVPLRPGDRHLQPPPVTPGPHGPWPPVRVRAAPRVWRPRGGRPLEPIVPPCRRPPERRRGLLPGFGVQLLQRRPAAVVRRRIQDGQPVEIIEALRSQREVGLIFCTARSSRKC